MVTDLSSSMLTSFLDGIFPLAREEYYSFIKNSKTYFDTFGESKKAAFSQMVKGGNAEEGTRTPTPVYQELAPQASVSANSTTSAFILPVLLPLSCPHAKSMTREKMLLKAWE